MKTFTSFLFLFVLYFSVVATAQNLLADGNMEDESAWTIINYKAEEAEYEFNYVSDGPAEGKDGCLEVSAFGTQETDIIFYQAVTLIGGSEYEINGAFKDLLGNITNFWCELLYDTAVPPDSNDFGGSIICGFNTWDGTTGGVDGTFQDDYIKGGGPIFTAPGDAGVPTTVYIVIDVGCWMGGTAYSFDVAIDEMSLTPVGGTSVKGKQITPDKFILYQNYPNPFNPTTKINFQIPSVGTSLMTFLQLKVYDILGREVAVLINEEKSAGNYEINFDASSLPSGIYLYKLESEKYIDMKKMLLLK